jgi:hypothetical protein
MSFSVQPAILLATVNFSHQLKCHKLSFDNQERAEVKTQCEKSFTAIATASMRQWKCGTTQACVSCPLLLAGVQVDAA